MKLIKTLFAVLFSLSLVCVLPIAQAAKFNLVVLCRVCTLGDNNLAAYTIVLNQDTGEKWAYGADRRNLNKKPIYLGQFAIDQPIVAEDQKFPK